jgi:ABC-type lipoprotein release transport system permease subunit
LSKAIVIGFFGGLLGSVIGFYLGGFIGAGLEQVSMETVRFATVFELKLFVLAIVLAPLLSAIASWIPSLIAAQQDPARILSKE